MRATRLSEIVHLYESDMLSLYNDFISADRSGNKREKASIVNRFLKVVRSLNRDIRFGAKKKRASLSGSRLKEWFSGDANEILHDMWSAKAIDELAISLLKGMRKKVGPREGRRFTKQIEKTKNRLKRFLRTSKKEIVSIAPDFWNDAYEEDFKKYLTR